MHARVQSATGVLGVVFIVNLLNLNLNLLKQLVHETSTSMPQLCVKRL
jgi:hypothetical protein